MLKKSLTNKKANKKREHLQDLDIKLGILNLTLIQFYIATFSTIYIIICKSLHRS